MKVIINKKTVEIDKNATVFNALSIAKINPETVLVKRKNKLIPHDELLRENDILELVSVISGG